MLSLDVPGTYTDSTLPTPGVADPLLTGANGGVRFLFDLASTLSWPSAAAPTDGAAITDIAAVGNGVARVTGSPAPTYAGGGFDFASTTGRPDTVQGPACLGGIRTATNQYFLVCGYFKLPSSGQWNSTASIAPIFTTTLAAGGYPSETDMLTIAELTGGALAARRQTAGGSVNDAVQLSSTNLAPHFGLVAQVAFWRNATEQRMQVRTSAGTVQTAAGAVGSNNTGDFSTKQPQWGVPLAFNNGNSSYVPNGLRVYRGWVEDLTLSGRTPATVLDSDWTTNASRFS